MQKKKQKKGISLIVLVITIVVMIILATTIIISLSSNGIIDKASEAVDKTNEKQVEELASLAWANAYADNVGKSDEELLQALKQSVEKALSDNNLDKEDYGMVVTTTGVTIAKGWLQTVDRKVIKGSTTLEIGDYVNYVSGVSGYTDKNGWYVLGAENGELLIMSASSVASKTFNEEKTLEGGRKAYENGISELNEICAPYGKGTYATKARSITADDINRVTGFDKTTFGSYEHYGDIKIGSGHGFDYQDVYHDDLSGLKVKSTYYAYCFKDYLSTSSKEYKMLEFGECTWLASRYCMLNHISGNIIWALSFADFWYSDDDFSMNLGKDQIFMYNSLSDCWKAETGNVRAVVELSSDTTLNFLSTDVDVDGLSRSVWNII